VARRGQVGEHGAEEVGVCAVEEGGEAGEEVESCEEAGRGD
jgi:hypothetical protein